MKSKRKNVEKGVKPQGHKKGLITFKHGLSRSVVSQLRELINMKVVTERNLFESENWTFMKWKDELERMVEKVMPCIEQARCQMLRVAVNNVPSLIRIMNFIAIPFYSHLVNLELRFCSIENIQVLPFFHTPFLREISLDLEKINSSSKGLLKTNHQFLQKIYISANESLRLDRLKIKKGNQQISINESYDCLGLINLAKLQCQQPSKIDYGRWLKNIYQRKALQAIIRKYPIIEFSEGYV